ncbi:uncharacterized protein LOC141691924 [Apium graveolens]|uniref:uncharacterized protein LOC141691924 n=1 Tax=Apium graveolens TaxID=4045 RepID=UPI003D795E54
MTAEKTGPAEDTISIPVDKNDPSKVLKVGSQLADEMRRSLARFLIANLDVFAWSHSDMIEIDPEVMCHHLNILPNCMGMRQKRRPVSGENAIALKEEVDRLLEVGLIKESFYPEWLANPVLVKKPNGKWRTCVDLTDLNKACPKDSFPLPRIDHAVLVREEDGQQSPVYYVSKRLHDAETRYTSMEKLVYALILASRKLRPYFQAHRVEVCTAYPLRQRLIGMFKEVRLECVPREKNSIADALAKMGSQQEAVLLGSIPLEIQEIPSIPEVETMRVDEAPKETWMTPILAYIRKGILPDDKFMARRLRYQAARYVIYDEVLYKRGFNQPLLRFGIPYKLVSDNRKQFDSQKLRHLCEELKIKKEFAAVYHPKSNGQTEAVMWSYNTTPRSTMGETPFMLTYGYEAMVPVEVGSGSLRRDCYRNEDVEVNQRLHLDLLEETRENSQLRLAAYQQRAARYYNKKTNEVQTWILQLARLQGARTLKIVQVHRR